MSTLYDGLLDIRSLAECHEDKVISDVVTELLEELALEKEKILLQEDIDAQDEQYFGDGLHSLIDTICHLKIDHGPNVIVRVTIERIEKHDDKSYQIVGVNENR